MHSAKIGDIIQIPTSIGEAYAQYTHQNALFGALIRILPGIFITGEIDLDKLINEATAFWVFFPLNEAIKQNIVTIVKNATVPSHAQEFPLFRSGVVDPQTGKVSDWWLWDGSRSWKIGELTEEQRKLPIRGSWNDTLLINRIEEGWRPELDKS